MKALVESSRVTIRAPGGEPAALRPAGPEGLESTLAVRRRLDLVGQRAMTSALRAWPGGLVVASHDRGFLSEIGVSASIELRSS